MKRWEIAWSACFGRIANPMVAIGIQRPRTDFDHISRDNPAAARRIVKAINDGCSSLQNFPNRGRIGMTGRRESVFAPLAVLSRVQDQRSSCRDLANLPWAQDAR